MPNALPRAVDSAEEALHAGKWLQARGKASEVLAQAGAAPADLTRAFYVLLQVDFHTGRCGAAAAHRTRTRARKRARRARGPRYAMCVCHAQQEQPHDRRPRRPRGRGAAARRRRGPAPPCGREAAQLSVAGAAAAPTASRCVLLDACLQADRPGGGRHILWQRPARPSSHRPAAVVSGTPARAALHPPTARRAAPRRRGGAGGPRVLPVCSACLLYTSRRG